MKNLFLIGENGNTSPIKIVKNNVHKNVKDIFPEREPYTNHICIYITFVVHLHILRYIVDIRFEMLVDLTSLLAKFGFQKK